MPPAPFPDPDPDTPEPSGSGSGSGSAGAGPRPVPAGGDDGAPEPPWSGEDEEDSAAYLGELMAAAVAGEELTALDISGAGSCDGEPRPDAPTPPPPPCTRSSDPGRHVTLIPGARLSAEIGRVSRANRDEPGLDQHLPGRGVRDAAFSRAVAALSVRSPARLRLPLWSGAW